GHNHPSGDQQPSAEDKATTRRLVQAGELLGIPILDHIIVGEGYFSFKESGLL
nr:DNA repair protein RadC [Nitrospirota bacterium]